jgi:hypothetical protein
LIGTNYYPYTVSLHIGITQPIPDYADWTEERMKRDIKRALNVGIDFLLISIDAWETQNNTRTASYRTFFKMLENSNLYACFMHEAHDAEHKDNVYVADWVCTNFANSSSYLRWKGRMLLVIYDCLADENFDDPRLTIRHTVWRKEWHWFDPYNSAPVLSKNGEQTIIFPGYCLGGQPEKWLCPRDNGTFYENQWKQALQLNPELILIATWNDFWEGTFIEPNNLDGYLMLDITKYYTQLIHFNSRWTRVGAIYLHPSSPEIPLVLTPDEPLNSWWNLNFSLFASQKYIDEMMLNRALSADISKSLAIYFPQFLADVDAFGTKYLEELEEVVVFFHEKGFHILLFLGRPDYNAYGRHIETVSNPSARAYLLKNINMTLRYKDMYNYIDEVTLYWMAYVTNYLSEEISEYDQHIKNVVNAVGVAFLVHVDGIWWEENLNFNGYTPESVSPKFGCSDGLFAESWAQGVLPKCLSQLIPEYFAPSQVCMICDVPNGYINPSRPNALGTVEKDMKYWFECIENAGITSWYMWDYYDSEAGVPSTYSLIYPNATTLTKKGEYVRSVTQMGLIYKDVAVTEAKLYKKVYGQNSTTYINTTILNQGDFTETFNFTILANSTIIHIQNVTLLSGNSTKIEFMWNVTLPVGNYTIRAEASIENDTDISDNVFIYGLITISIPGDINADGKVNIIDIAIAARAFGSKLGEERFEPNADLNEDGVTNILDISAIAREFGETVGEGGRKV